MVTKQGYRRLKYLAAALGMMFTSPQLQVLCAQEDAAFTEAAAEAETGAAVDTAAGDAASAPEADPGTGAAAEEAPAAAPFDEDAASIAEADAGGAGNMKKKKADKDKEEPTVDTGGLIIDEGASSDSIAGDPVFSLEELWAEEYTFPGFEVDPSRYPAANINVNTIKVYRFLMEEMGINHAAACGVLANVQLESNFRPLALGDGGTSYGICQWHNGRFTHLMNYCKSRDLDYNTLEGQLSFLGYELTHGYRRVYEALKHVEDTAGGAYVAAYLFCYHFEMPDQTLNRSIQRGNLAKTEYYDKDMEQLEWELIHEELLLEKNWLKKLKKSYGPLWDEDFHDESDKAYEDQLLPEWNSVLGEPADIVDAF